MYRSPGCITQSAYDRAPLLPSPIPNLDSDVVLWQDDPRYGVVDPICTFVFALLVLLTTRLILSDICDVLMERVPRSLDVATITAQLCRVRRIPALAFSLPPPPFPPRSSAVDEPCSCARNCNHPEKHRHFPYQQSLHHLVWISVSQQLKWPLS